MNAEVLPRISFLSSQAEQLRNLLTGTGSGHERAAWLLFRKFPDTCDFSRGKSPRYVCVQIIPIPEELVIFSSETTIKIKTSQLTPLMRQAAASDLVVGFIHSHPSGADWFSSTDDDNELDILKSIYNRNGTNAELVAAIVTQDGNWRGRVRSWKHTQQPCAARHIAIIGKQLSINVRQQELGADAEQFHRQSLAFGEPFTARLRQLRVAVVGAGGTGSAVAALLARLGVGELLVIDADRLETSNLNRVHGASRNDAQRSSYKAVIQRDYLNALGIGCEVVSLRAWVDELEGAEALRTVDVIFGCTDDHLGRQALNRAAHFWMQPLFDVGLDSAIDETVKPSVLRNLDIRVSIVIPDASPCLRCQRVIDDRKATAEELRRRDPKEYEKLEKEAYVRGAGQRNPGVVSYTTMVACLAVDELTERLQPYKNRDVSISNTWWQFVSDSMRHLSRASDRDCPYCGTKKFLLGDESAGLLGRPALKSRSKE